ncbi:MAG TPA: rhomboid family intramembrane serine protease [Acidobacteriaceae bacterium]|jgi:membrane associated rhomboid family serine protease|nr:rhomboid family intramembrane serine protease [Acidobacteriaceae bacterium]
MARFPRTGLSLSFPSFSGVTSQLVLANVVVFFVLLLMQYAAPHVALIIVTYFALTPALLLHGFVWQLATYSFLNAGVLHVAFNMLTLWFIGSFLETSKGSRWLLEVYFLCAIGGGLIGSALSFTHIFHSSPVSATSSSDAALFGLLAAFAVLFGDLELYMFPLPVAIKAKYLVIVYMLIEIALLLSGGPPLAYFVILSGALLGLLFARRAPRRGMSMAFSEGFFNLRNNYYRWKRRRVARKFEVYMRKQNRDVRFDSEGRYIDPDEKRDPNDRKWMN